MENLVAGLTELLLTIKTRIMNLGMREGLIAVGILFVGILYAGSRISGWHKLAEHYVSQNRYQGEWISSPDSNGEDADGVIVDLNHSESDGAIKLGADDRGLYLSMSLGFRLFHPPLFVPWNDVRSEWIQGAPWSKKKNILRITFDLCPGIPLDVDRHVAGEIQERAEGRWKMPEDG